MKPNIIIFNPDQMRADVLAHLGNPASITPNLDLFAEKEAVSFSNAFCQNPVCVPSRCSFFTGLYPHVHGHRTMNYMLRSEESSLLQELKKAGYYVWMNKRNDFLPAQNPEQIKQHCDVFFQGFEGKLNPGTENENPRGEPGSKNYYSFYNGRLMLDENGKNCNQDEEDVNKAIDLIKNRPTEQPLCIFLGLFYPHVPYQIEEPYFSAINPNSLSARIPKPLDIENRPKMMLKLHEHLNLENLSDQEWDRIRTCYLGMSMKIDVLFGRLCDALKEAGIYDDTDIYFFSDHGDFTGDYDLVCKAQNLMQDCLTNVPLLIKPHRGVQIDPGISESMTELVDFYATAIDLAGIESDHNHFGRSLRPVLADRLTSHREFVTCEGGRTREEIEQCSETGGVEPARNNLFWPRMTAQLDNIAHTKATMIRTNNYKYIKRLYESDEFYDLRIDSSELKNEINNPTYEAEIVSLKLQLLNWYQATCDIVPKKMDSSITTEMILQRVRNQLSPDRFADFSIEAARTGGLIGPIIALCDKYHVRALI